MLLAACYGHLGRTEDARAAWAELLKVNPGFSLTQRARVLPYKDPRIFSASPKVWRRPGCPRRALQSWAGSDRQTCSGFGSRAYGEYRSSSPTLWSRACPARREALLHVRMEMRTHNSGPGRAVRWTIAGPLPRSSQPRKTTAYLVIIIRLAPSGQSPPLQIGATEQLAPEDTALRHR